jgi:SAM-dependent methyltransferase
MSCDSDPSLVPSKKATATDKLRDFWNQHFSEQEDTEDWFADFSALRPTLSALLSNAAHRVLIVGCGMSALAADLFDSHLATDISSVDISEVAIQNMQQRYASSHPQLKWAVGDVCDLRPAFPTDAAFDVILDKGTADTLLFRCHGAAERERQLSGMISEMRRLLAPGGRFIWFTLRRKPPVFYERVHEWEVETHRVELQDGIQKCFSPQKRVLYCHICRARPSRMYSQRQAQVDARLLKRRQMLLEASESWLSVPASIKQMLGESDVAALNSDSPAEDASLVPLLSIAQVYERFHDNTMSWCGHDQYAESVHQVSVIGRLLKLRNMSRCLVFADLIDQNSEGPKLQLMMEQWSAEQYLKRRPDRCIEESPSPVDSQSLSFVPFTYPPGIESETCWSNVDCLRSQDVVICTGVPGRSLNGTFSLRLSSIQLLVPRDD